MRSLSIRGYNGYFAFSRIIERLDRRGDHFSRYIIGKVLDLSRYETLVFFDKIFEIIF